MKLSSTKLRIWFKRIIAPFLVCSSLVAIALAQTPNMMPVGQPQPAIHPHPLSSAAPQQQAAISPSTPVSPVSPVTADKITDTSMSSPQPTTRLWNLQDADILSVISEVSQETGKNFVVDPRVAGKITLISSRPLRQGE